LKPLCVLFSHLFFGMFISHFLEEGGRGGGVMAGGKYQ
jgi:hypothetical protein